MTSANDSLWVNGVGRSIDPSNPEQAAKVIEVYFNRELSDDELRAFHDQIRALHVKGTSE